MQLRSHITIINACMQVKQSLLATGVFHDNILTHLVSGLGAGFFAVCVGSPMDVIKSRMMGMLNTNREILRHMPPRCTQATLRRTAACWTAL